ncbi:MAG: DNA mismatch repair protein MutS [Luteitalea sp.]|nr:DNA mismatch repair protein MutS [Luteitalea sp.]
MNCTIAELATEVPIEREIDLHAFAPRDIPSVVEEFVSAAARAGLTEVRLVHGRGRGVQRGIVQSTLDRHPLVLEFWDDGASHLGATMARIGPGR